MADSNSPTPTPDDPNSEKAKRLRSVINQALSAEVTLGGAVAAAAAKVEYAAALAAEGIEASFVAELATLAEEATMLLGSSGDKSTEKKVDTIDEEDAKKALLKLISAIQTRAKRTYLKADDPRRDNYYIGLKFSTTRTLLETSSQAIIDRLGVDTLKGMKPTDVTEMQAARKAYVNSQTSQSGAQAVSTTTHAQCEAKVKELAVKRREIQYAVEAVWPSTDPLNAGIRREFGLRPDHPMK